jgi:Zn-dependent protease with chaperone function
MPAPRLRPLPWLLLAAALTACAPTTQRAALDDGLVEEEAKKQRSLALQTQMQRQARLTRIAYPILESAALLCKDKTRLTIGALYVNTYSFSPELRAIAAQDLKLTDELTVIQVPPGSPGEIAGLKERDVLVALNTQPIPRGEFAAKAFFEITQTQLQAGVPAELTVRRDAVEQTLVLNPDLICSFPVVVGPGDDVNAYADGSKVVIQKGMMRFAESDDEIALVVAHELAHNAMTHVQSQTTNYWLGSVVDILAAAYGINTGGLFGSMASNYYSKDFEAEADYVGLYMLARSGGNIEGAPLFWRRLAAENPGSIDRGGMLASHPATPERFVAMEATIKEIEAKRAANQPLLPNLENSPGVAAPEK